MSDAPESIFFEKSKPSNTNAVLPIPGNALHTAIPLIDLFHIIFTKLHPLFAIDCAVILIYDEQLTVIKEAYASAWISDEDKVYYETFDQPLELTALQKSIAKFSFPVVKTAKEWIEEENINQIVINGNADHKYHCYIPLEIGNKTLGTLELHNNLLQLSTECLTFCSNIADFIAEMIYLQRTRNFLSEDRTLNANKIDNTEPTADYGFLSDLNQRPALIEGPDALENFVTWAEKLFPSGYEKIKSELKQLIAFKAQMEDEQLSQPEMGQPRNIYPEIIGAGPRMSKVFALMGQVGPSESTVLILGETGTGKELIARAIHEGSARKNKTMIKVNCAAIPANLIESELFGHERGAFTGATDRRIGKFEQADNSTLFLDEIGELPLDLQVKLLRVLQEKEIERVGGKTTIKVDVRVISATNRNLLTEVERGLFREDLYYRLNVFPISLPSLKERADDIPLLAAHFLDKYARKSGKHLVGFTQKAIKQMCNYTWPGNVREMEHLIERQVLLSTKPLINEINIPTVTKTITDKNGARQKVKTIDENERDHIFAVLQLCKGRISGNDGAAKLLGVPATTLNSKMKRLGLHKTHF